ncbi:MAG: peptidylprolyl isomerase [Planctomycetota bacterium]
MHWLTTPRSFAACCIAVLALVVPVAPVSAQITPERTYYGIDRSIPVRVAAPQQAAGAVSIALHTASGEEVAREEVLPGAVDLATFFPVLWSTSTPELLYAQAYAGSAPLGPPVVLQPMITPQRPQSVPGRDGRPTIRWSPVGDVYSGIRAYVDKHLILETTEGEVRFRLRPDEAPNTVWHIRELVRGGFYTDIAFHRIVNTHPSGHPFVIQVGDPVGSGLGGPGVFIDLEPSALQHRFGVLSMARSPDPDTNGSQFFVALSRQATTHLDGNYTGFGEAVSGAEVIQAIASVELLPSGQPVTAPRIVAARLVDAPSIGTGPDPVARPQPANPRR